MSQGNSKEYEIYDSINKETYIIKSLAAFCKEYKLNESCMRDVALGKQMQHRGFYCKYKDDIKDLKEIFLFKEKSLIKKEKKIITKEERYNQSEKYLDFISNIHYYYNEYYIRQQLSCSKISNIIGVSPESIRINFIKNNLPRINEITPICSNFDIIYDMHYNKNMSCISIAKKLGVSHITIIRRIHEHKFCPKRRTISSYEIEIQNWLKELNINFEICNRKLLNNKEIDIFIPEKKLGIEINGIFWHGYNKKESKEEIFKHFDKMKISKEKGIKLLQFTDYEWIYKKDICKSIILNNMNFFDKKIRASKCEFYLPTEEEYKIFLEKNHIQGYVAGSNKLALKYDNEIVSIMSIGKARYSNNRWELLRFCNKINYKIYGGASKLFDKIKKDDIISYCSLDYFSGELYEKLGFKLSHITNPNYFYYYNEKIFSRIEAQKHKLIKILDNYDKNLTEYQNMFNNKFIRYWNCGNSVWIYKKE